MPALYPDYGADLSAIESAAEAKLYQALRNQLDDSFTVLHSVAWIVRRRGKTSIDGEADFLIAHPDHGLLIVEVKGGGIRRDQEIGTWSSIDRDGVRHEINDPLLQARRGKFAIIDKLREHPDAAALRLDDAFFGHAVFLPDIGDVRPFISPDAPGDLLGCSKDLKDVHAWTERAFRYWRGQSKISERQLGSKGVALVRRVFARVVEVRPRFNQHLDAEEGIRLQLTKQQVRVLDGLSRARRVVISGGAGTGKTVLALEKARRLASEGFRTLLTCYNSLLCDELAKAAANTPNLMAMNLHRLCKVLAAEAGQREGRNLEAEAVKNYPNADYFKTQLPAALVFAAEILGPRFDALVVDEAQDFTDAYWFPLELLLTDAGQDPIYIFLDENQNLYRVSAEMPKADISYLLTANCRNTKAIHDVMARYYAGSPFEPPAIAGAPIISSCATDTAGQAGKIASLVRAWVEDEAVPPESIVVLIADRFRRREYEAALSHHQALPALGWTTDKPSRNNAIRVDTVARFKGLEASIVVLWGLDTLVAEERNETIYTGLSRAKNLIVLVGTHATCRNVIAGL